MTINKFECLNVCVSKDQNTPYFDTKRLVFNIF